MKSMTKKGNYEDILNLPHPDPKTHPRMSMMARAAQFAPFAALTGHNAAIDETARLTESEPVLDEMEQGDLNRKIRWLQEHIEEHPFVRLTHFVPDSRKAGGSFAQTSANLKDIDIVEQEVKLTNGDRIALQSILGVDCKSFPEFGNEGPSCD